MSDKATKAAEARLKKMSGPNWKKLPACPKCDMKHGYVACFNPGREPERHWYCKACGAKGDKG